jgi:raffinose/stachyose/melibiose transport system substrate-binding protein
MKRFIALLLATLVLATLFSGCGSKGTTDTQASTTQETNKDASTAPEEKKLSGKIVYDTGFTNLIDTKLKDFAKEFMDLHPGTEVEITALTDGDKTQKIRMAANEMHDVTFVIPTLKSSDISKYYIPLDDLGYTKDNLYFYDAGLGSDGKLYKMSQIIYYSGMVYNKKVFADAGITQTPKTWDEFYAACDKIKAKGITPVASDFKDAWPLQYYANADYYASGSGNPNYLNDLVGKDFLTDDGGLLTGIKYLKILKDKGYLENDLMSTSWDGFGKDFPQGKFGMHYLGSWYPGQFVEKGGKLEDIGMFPLPGLKTLQINYDIFLGVAANTKNPDLAKAFLKYMFDDGKFAAVVGAVSPMKGVKAGAAPFVEELLSSGLPVVEQVPATDDFNAILNKAQISWTNMIQEYLLAKDPNTVVAKYNTMWADAKKALGK